MNESPFIKYLRKPIWIIVPVSVWLSFELMGSLSSAYLVGGLAMLYTLKDFIAEGLILRIEEYKFSIGEKKNEAQILEATSNYLAQKSVFTFFMFLIFFPFLIGGLIFLKEELGIKIISNEAQKTFQSAYQQ